MAFQPFGYRFEVSSPLTPEAVRAAIRSRKKGWFDPGTGARGWIIGPFMCLWLSAFDRYGPMLVGRISGDTFGSLIVGRAGSDLNGIAVQAVCFPIFVLLVQHMAATGDYSRTQLAILAGVVLLGPLNFWLAHKNRREAEPLVRFLEDVAGRSLRREYPKLDPALTLEVNGGRWEEADTTEVIGDGLLAMGLDGVLILGRGPETYIQTASSEEGYVLEAREGSVSRHFRGRRRTPGAANLFTFEEVRQALLAYATGAPTPAFLSWEPMRLAT